MNFLKILLSICLLIQFNPSMAVTGDMEEDPNTLGAFRGVPKEIVAHIASFLDTPNAQNFRNACKFFKSAIPTRLTNLKPVAFLSDSFFNDPSFGVFIQNLKQNIPDFDKTLGIDIKTFLNGALDRPDKWKVFERFVVHFPEKIKLMGIESAAANKLSMENYFLLLDHFPKLTFPVEKLTIVIKGGALTPQIQKNFSRLPWELYGLSLDFPNIDTSMVSLLKNYFEKVTDRQKSNDGLGFFSSHIFRNTPFSFSLATTSPYTKDTMLLLEKILKSFPPNRKIGHC